MTFPRPTGGQYHLSCLVASVVLVVNTIAQVNAVPERLSEEISISSKKRLEPQGQLRTIKQNGRLRYYFMHLPPGYANATKLPVVIVLHGAVADYKNVARVTGMSQKADSENFIVVYPNGTGVLRTKFLTWNAGDCCGYSKRHGVDDIAFLNNLLNELTKDPQVDMSRIYVAGFSNGAMLALLLGCELSTRLSAIASVSGSMTGREKPPSKAVPVVIIHGTADRHVPYNGGLGRYARFGFPVNKQSVAYAVQFWTKHNNCASNPQTTKFGHVVVNRYCGTQDGEEVMLCSIDGGGHSWPGGKKSRFYSDSPTTELSATDLIWEFFRKHRRDIEGTATAHKPLSQPYAIMP